MVCGCLLVRGMGTCVTSFFFFNDTATTEIYTLSLHDALPISFPWPCPPFSARRWGWSLKASSEATSRSATSHTSPPERSEEHTSELQSRLHLVCRLLLEKKKKHRSHQTSILTSQRPQYCCTPT